MNIKEKIALFQTLNKNEILREKLFYDVLEKCADNINYFDYMTTHPIECDVELKRLPTADYDLCCALLTMLLREDHFNNGAFERRQRKGQVKPIVERIITLLSSMETQPIKFFSEKAIEALGGYYVYALIDPRNDKAFYIGKGTENRIFAHEIESGKLPRSEKEKHLKIREIENDGFSVKRVVVNWGLTESEAYASEASLINLLNLVPDVKLTNEASGHHVHEAMTVEAFEHFYGAVPLENKDIKHSILVIKINRLYRRDMSKEKLYDTVRGYWSASINSIKRKNVEYVFGVYNGFIVAVYKPDEWYYTYENIDAPQRDKISDEEYERLKNRIYFVCKDYENLDDDGKFYLYKSIANLKANQTAQNPITYLSPETV